MNDPRIERIIALARTQIGVHEGRSGSNWNNQTRYAQEVPGLQWAQGQAWCATFVSWLALKSGLADLYPRTASVAEARNWFQGRNQWSEYPAIGAQIIYGSGAHTGIVVAFDSTTVTTIEGNINNNGSAEGDGVYLKTRPRRDPWVTGYGYPAIPLTSADPNYRPRPITTTAKPAPATVSLSRLQRSAVTDSQAKGQPKSYPDGTTRVELALKAEGLLAQGLVDGSFGTVTITAYAAWQRRLGYKGRDANGIPGRATLTALGAKHGFNVSA